MKEVFLGGIFCMGKSVASACRRIGVCLSVDVLRFSLRKVLYLRMFMGAIVLNIGFAPRLMMVFAISFMCFWCFECCYRCILCNFTVISTSRGYDLKDLTPKEVPLSVRVISGGSLKKLSSIAKSSPSIASPSFSTIPTDVYIMADIPDITVKLHGPHNYNECIYNNTPQSTTTCNRK